VARISVALFGGSFNPPHIGHVLAIAYVLSAELAERVVAVPVFEHALRKQLVPFQHRVAMAERAFGWLPRVEVSSIEEQLGAPSRTLQTIVALEAQHPDWDLRLMVGSDILGEIHQWHAFDEIERRAPLLVLPRAGVTAPASAMQPAAAQPAAVQSAAMHSAAALLPEVSSTEVRALLGAAASGVHSDVLLRLQALVPRAVLAYVREHGLYRQD
jgi:nicotinate-nucleotide adenylyltransferase